MHLTVHNSAFTNYCTYYVFNRHNIIEYAYVIMTHASGPPLFSSCYWQLLPHQMAVTRDQASIANTHAHNRKIHYSDCVVAKVWFGYECLCVSRPRYALVQNCVTQDGVWTRLFYAYIFQNHEQVLTFLHEGGLLKSDMNCSKCNNMRSCRYESKTDNITASVENGETIMYKQKSLNHRSPLTKVTTLKQSYHMPQKNNITYKNTNWLVLILQRSFTGLYRM